MPAQAVDIPVVCEQYGRLLTSYVAPNLVVGSPEYRAIFFPARDECISRGGPQFMPNGYAAQPYFRPGPATPPPPAAPCTGSSSSTGAASGPRAFALTAP